MPEYTKPTRLPRNSSRSRQRRFSNAWKINSSGVERITKENFGDLVQPDLVVGDTSHYMGTPEQTVIANSAASSSFLFLPKANTYEGRAVTVIRNNNALTTTLWLSRGVTEDRLDDATVAQPMMFDGQSQELISDGNDNWYTKSARTAMPTWRSAITTLTAATSTYNVVQPEQVLLVSTGATNTNIRLPVWPQWSAGQSSVSIYVKKIDSGAGRVRVWPLGATTIDGVSLVDLNNQWNYLVTYQATSNWVVQMKG